MNRSDGDELLERVLAGDLDPDSERVRAALARDPALAAELEALRAVERRALGAAAEERADRDAAARADPAPGEAAAVARLRALARGAGGRARALPLRGPWLAAAALILLASLLALGRLLGGSGGTGDVLGERVRLLRPLGEAPASLEFAWEAELPPGGWYDLAVRALDDGAELVRAERLRAPEYAPDAETRARLDEPFAWEVFVREAGGTIAASGSATVRP